MWVLNIRNQLSWLCSKCSTCVQMYSNSDIHVLMYMFCRTCDTWYVIHVLRSCQSSYGKKIRTFWFFWIQNIDFFQIKNAQNLYFLIKNFQIFHFDIKIIKIPIFESYSICIPIFGYFYFDSKIGIFGWNLQKFYWNRYWYFHFTEIDIFDLLIIVYTVNIL